VYKYMYMGCRLCGNILEGKRRKFCSVLHKNLWYRKNPSKEEVLCERCGQNYSRRVAPSRLRRRYCPTCHRVSNTKRDVSGSNNPMWRGGHRHWMSGRNSALYRKLRKIVQQRDRYTCQNCGKHKDQLGYMPQCNHKKPYRLGGPHDLDNLELLCYPCHKRADAKIPALWGGKPFGGHVGKTPLPTCVGCKRKIKVIDDKCGKCRLIERRKIACEMRDAGYSHRLIGDRFGVTPAAVWNWLNRKV